MRRGILLLALTGCASLPAPARLEIRVEPEALQGDEVQLYIKIRGPGQRTVRVELIRSLPAERREVAARPVAPAGDETLLVAFTARDRGSFTVRVEAGGDVAEAPLHVTSRVLRVLYVEHPPRYEYRFLKNALIRDPEILVHCFLTSADEGFPQEHSKSDHPLFRESLQEFPKDLKSLLDFDVILYGDVDPAKLGPEAAGHLSSFVTEFGGGLLFIPGIHDAAALRETPLEDLLPVRVQGEVSSDLRARVAPDGRGFFPFEFEGLLALRWMLDATLKKGAIARVDADGHPLFVTREAGRGRVFWSATDETWLWRKGTGDEPVFYPLWRRAIEWAARGR